ncbi:MAG: glycosyltransferase family 2 protein [Candidatus Shapirobacteria bacterium]
MTVNPTVSIIIPTWNTADITLKCIETITKYLPQDYYEIIIVDNASTDKTQQIFSKIQNIKYIRNSTNLGFSQANNIGVKKAIGKYLFFLNSDMELIDSSLVDIVNYFSNNPQTGVIGPQFLNPDLSIQGSITPPQTVLNAFKEYWLGISNSYTKFYSNTTSSVHAISGGAIVISKTLFNKIGGWDERYFFYYEDLELCRQIHKQNLKVIYFPNCKVIHRHGASGSKITNDANQWRRLIPSAKIYFGSIKYYLIFLVIKSSQIFHRFFTK